MRIGQFGDFKTLCDFKLCDCIVRKILLTINFGQIKFVRNLIMQSSNDSHKAQINTTHIFIALQYGVISLRSIVAVWNSWLCTIIQYTEYCRKE